MLPVTQDRVLSSGRDVVDNYSQSMWKKAVVASSKVLSWRFPRGSEGNHEKFQFVPVGVRTRHVTECKSETLPLKTGVFNPLPAGRMRPSECFLRPPNKFWILSVKSLIQINKCWIKFVLIYFKFCSKILNFCFVFLGMKSQLMS
jgi:hypothetical protein